MALQDWIDAYEELELVNDSTWKANFADYLGDLLDNTLNLATYTSPGALGYPAFTFARSAFSGALTDVNGFVGLQTAFNNAVLASTFSIPIGTTYGAGTPAETFSTVGVAVPDPPSIAAAQAKLALLASDPVTNVADESKFPVRLREAFLLLTYTVTGTNSVAPTPGPITDALRAVTNV